MVGASSWVTGALSTLLRQSPIERVGHAVSARRYAGVRALAGGGVG